MAAINIFSARVLVESADWNFGKGVLVPTDKGLIYACHSTGTNQSAMEMADWILSCYIPKEWVHKSPFGEESYHYRVVVEVEGATLNAWVDPRSPSVRGWIEMQSPDNLDEEEEPPRLQSIWGLIGFNPWGTEPMSDPSYRTNWEAFKRLAARRFLSLVRGGRTTAEAIEAMAGSWDQVPSQYQDLSWYIIYAIWDQLFMERGEFHEFKRVNGMLPPP